MNNKDTFTHVGEIAKRILEKNMSQVERPILRYFGGKWRLAPWIIDHFPQHSVYAELFGGGGVRVA